MRKKNDSDRKILFFGVALPLLAVAFESISHFCAKNFFDPFPSTSHILLFLLIPLSNCLWLLASRRDLSAHYGSLSLVSGMALGVGVMYSLMCLPMLAASLFFLGAFGFGLLGLAPYLSLPVSWKSAKNICKLCLEKKTYFDPHQTEHIGHLIILVMVLAVELPSTMTRIHLGMAAKPETSIQGISWLRKYGNEEVMLRACYERSGRATDIVGTVYEANHPLKIDEARRIFYRVTGKAFNSVAIPAAARATIQHALSNDPGSLNANVEDEFDLDTDIAGEVVSGVARGLSISQSNFTGCVDADTLIADVDWSFSFGNVSKYDREARSKILLPPGSVVTRAILTLHGKEHEATIMLREAARQYYRQSVMEHKKDPLLVSACGPDQVLVQCYPIPPGSDTKIKLHIVCPLAVDGNSAALSLPIFSEKNFQSPKWNKLTFDGKLPLKLICNSRIVSAKNLSVQNGNLNNRLIMNVDSNDLERFEAIVQGMRSTKCTQNIAFCRSEVRRKGLEESLHVVDPLMEPHFKMPSKLVVLIDGSIGSREHLPEIIKGLASIPQSCLVSVVLASDEENKLCQNARPGTTEFNAAMYKLAQSSFVGGQDNSASLVRSLNSLKGIDKDSAVLWIHGPQPVSSRVDLRIFLNGKAGAKDLSLYDFQLNSGPVEVLNEADCSSRFRRVPLVGSISKDLIHLYQTWKPADFQSGDNQADEVECEMPESMAQLWQFRWVMNALRNNEQNHSMEELYETCFRYHLITRLSSAVVKDELISELPLKRREPVSNILTAGDFLTARNIVSACQKISPEMNQVASGLACVLMPPLALSGCSTLSDSKNSESFDKVVSQLNRLNAVTNAGTNAVTDAEADSAGAPSQLGPNLPSHNEYFWIAFDDVLILCGLFAYFGRRKKVYPCPSKV